MLRGMFWKGKTRSLEDRLKISQSMRGKKRSEETKKKISESFKKLGLRPLVGKGKNHHNYGKKILKISGKNHWNWIEDRSKLKKQYRNDGAYKDWRKQVWLRDKFTCRIADNNCDGRIEAHHILGFAEYPELRYQVNNGITLCHAHHPRKRAEEKRLIPTFQELVSVSSE